jgi:dihydrofolate reductase
MGEAIGALTGDADGILLGRTTYEMFAPAWRGRTAQDDPGAPFFNDTEKLVVGAQEPREDWGPTTRLGPYDATRLRDLKDSRSGSLYISGSGRLVRGLIADGLLDELHLFVYPVVLGSGARLFGEERTRFDVVSTDTYDNGVQHVVLAPRS